MNASSIINRILFRDPNMAPRLCYSQDGEDLILERLFDGQTTGFFVDIGAHHPVRFSNTYLFYLKGWRGLNVDAQPGSMKAFRRYRSRDINLECGVGVEAGVLPYFRFNEPALNTFDEAEANRKNVAPYRLLETVDVKVRRLDEILDQTLPPGQYIDFMTVDVEGKDFDVLRSNNWDRYRPRFVLAETLRTHLSDMHSCAVVQLLDSVGYRAIGKAYNTTFFERTLS